VPAARRSTDSFPEAVPEVAVTSALALVVSVAVAIPSLSVVVVVGVMLPVVVLNVTGAPGTEEPASSSTRAEIVDVPPIDGSCAGDAARMIVLEAADPTLIDSSADRAPPEKAMTFAVPD
jgi:hypothetical protein